MVGAAVDGQRLDGQRLEGVVAPRFAVEGSESARQQAVDAVAEDRKAPRPGVRPREGQLAEPHPGHHVAAKQPLSIEPAVTRREVSPAEVPANPALHAARQAVLQRGVAGEPGVGSAGAPPDRDKAHAEEGQPHTDGISLVSRRRAGLIARR